MSDPNPYESPREPPPPSTGQVVKRGVGVVTILLLTPLAVLIAAGASCAATIAVVDSPPFAGKYGLAFIVGWAIFLPPPIAALAAMIWWARHTYVRDQAARQTAAPEAFRKSDNS
jgi:hypothetical protein